MMTRVETAMSPAIVDFRAMGCQGATGTPAIASRWAELRSALMRWSARQRLGRSIAHLDDRLLADAGLTPMDLGLGERLIRRYAAGGSIWEVDKTG